MSREPLSLSSKGEAMEHTARERRPQVLAAEKVTLRPQASPVCFTPTAHTQPTCCSAPLRMTVGGSWCTSGDGSSSGFDRQGVLAIAIHVCNTTLRLWHAALPMRLGSYSLLATCV
jgi:hypothetical protein